MKDLYSRISADRAVSPVSDGDNTALVSQIIDLQGYHSLVFIIAAGSLADADATFAVLVEDGETNNLADAAAVADGFLRGTEADASYTFADDNVVKKIGYVGNKRYVRLTITPANNASAALFSAVAIKGDAELQPAA
ncbi:hypothetical protein [Sphingomonas sp. SRS2]|uniref:hypothetical protein n=1 Tax=Sphingomonas sp. SRS2 TaxID=133190 RepID=UPI00061844EB|nr:hypothetical protein [Sphingomonas sp. SRS2]KKC24926.1 hypothetical protein WP12_17055 [Sphingomonas sp. SRS2]